VISYLTVVGGFVYLVDLGSCARRGSVPRRYYHVGEVSKERSDKEDIMKRTTATPSAPFRPSYGRTEIAGMEAL
jgi:hypothetical protein